MTLFLVESVQEEGGQLGICQMQILLNNCVLALLLRLQMNGKRENLEDLSVQVLDLAFRFFSQRDEKLNVHKHSLLETYYP